MRPQNILKGSRTAPRNALNKSMCPKHRRQAGLCTEGTNFNIPVQNVQDIPACAYTAALPHFCIGMCYLPLGRMTG